jgi:hypothetical protein
MRNISEPTCAKSSDGLRQGVGAGLAAGLAAVLAAFGCSQGTEVRSDESAELAPSVETPETPVQLPAEGELVGVAVDHDAQQRFVLDQSGKFYQVDSAAPVLVFDASGQTDELGNPAVFTDAVSLGGYRFALTAQNTGFLLDLSASTIEVYFCYLPSIEPTEPGAAPVPTFSLTQQLLQAGISATQRTESVGYNATLGALYAQPQTFTDDWATLVGSEVFMFDLTGGEPIAWLQIDTQFIAGGMIAQDDGTLVFGRGRELFLQSAGAQPAFIGDLSSTAPTLDVRGMAVDLDGTWLLLDGPGRRLLNMSPVGLGG